MAYTMEESRKAFEEVRKALLDEADESMLFSDVIALPGFATYISDENERIEFIAKRHGKEFIAVDGIREYGEVVTAGTAAGDGTVDVTFGAHSFSHTPTAGDSEVDVAVAIAAEVNSKPGWSAITAGGTVSIFNDGSVYRGSVTGSATDTGFTVTSKDFIDQPAAFVSGRVTLNGRHSIFPGTAFRAPAP